MVLTRSQIRELSTALLDFDSNTFSENLDSSSLTSFESQHLSDSSQDNYEREDWNVSYDNESLSNMSISDISNPYAGEINLSDRVGVSLYSTAIKGLPEERKLVFSQEKAMHFKSEIDKANT